MMVSSTAYHTVHSNSKGFQPSTVEGLEVETASTISSTADEEAPSNIIEDDCTNSHHAGETSLPLRTSRRDHDPTLECLVCHLYCCGLFRWRRVSCIYWGFFQPILRFLHRARWLLARPLQTRLFPRRLLHCCTSNNRHGNREDAKTEARGPGLLDLLRPVLEVPFCGGTWCRALKHLTYGHVLLGSWILWWVAKKIHYTYTGLPNEGQAVGMSGIYATLVMWAAFGTAFKANNTLPALCCGFSFVNLIPWHALTSALALSLGFWHGVLAYQRWGLAMIIEGDRSHLGSIANGTNMTTVTNNSDVYTVVYDSIANTTSYTAHLGVDYGLAIGTRRPWQFLWDGWINWSGTGLVAAFAVLVFSSWFPQLRRRCYRPWFALHLASCLVTLYFGWVHFRIVLPLFAAWGLDWATRYGALARGKYAKTKADISIVPNTNLIKLSWPREQGGFLNLNFNYQPGQFVKVAVPSLGCDGRALDFHPISLASSPHQETVHVLVRPLGHWSKKLHQLVLSLTCTDASEISEPSEVTSATASGVSLSSLSTNDDGIGNYQSTGSMAGYNETKTGAKYSSETLPILIEGPYGSHSLEYPGRSRPFSFHQPYFALFVSGGVGMAPMQSIALDMLHWHVQSQRQWASSVGGGNDVGGLAKLRFVWSVRELELVESILAPDLKECSYLDQNGDAPLVETEIYHTRGFPEKECNESRSATARIHSGQRPDLSSIFLQTREDVILRYPNVRRILVFCCGPSTLTDQVEEFCDVYSTPVCERPCNCFRYQSLEAEGGGSRRGVVFELHKEVFEF